jgi:hypothetical protein
MSSTESRQTRRAVKASDTRKATIRIYLNIMRIRIVGMIGIVRIVRTVRMLREGRGGRHHRILTDRIQVRRTLSPAYPD